MLPCCSLTGVGVDITISLFSSNLECLVVAASAVSLKVMTLPVTKHVSKVKLFLYSFIYMTGKFTI